MPPNLLNLPQKIRLRILACAVILKPTIIEMAERYHCQNCTTFRLPPEAYPERGFDGNPHLGLYLICFTITREMMSVNFPLLNLKMCGDGVSPDAYLTVSGITSMSGLPCGIVWDRSRFRSIWRRQPCLMCKFGSQSS